MTDRGAPAPATTPRGRESPMPPPSHAPTQTNRGLRFERMERMFGKAEDPPSDAAGTPVSYGRISRASSRVSGASWKRSAIGSSVSALAPPQP